MRKEKSDLNPAEEKHQRKLDLAARAAWLYYIGNNTQDQIAEKLHVSRQAAQRLVSLAVAEKLIKFRLDHPIAECAELAGKLCERFGLRYCKIAPADDSAGLFNSLGICAAEYLEGLLTSQKPSTLAFGTGRTLRALVGQIPAMQQPQHKIVSIVGNMSHDGRASHFEAVMHLADKIHAQAFLLQTPVVTSTEQEKQFLQALPAFRTVHKLALQADAVFVGISQIGSDCPMYQDGFLNTAELKSLLKHKAVGEIIGWSFDKDGRILDCAVNDRIGSIPLADLKNSHVVAVSGGPEKTAPILGALRGKLIAGLITDENTARKLLKS